MSLSTRAVRHLGTVELCFNEGPTILSGGGTGVYGIAVFRFSPNLRDVFFSALWTIFCVS